MPQYALFLYAPQIDDASKPDPDALKPYDEHSEALQKSGIMRAAFALEGPHTATSLRGAIITDGPFLESKELIAGFTSLRRPAWMRHWPSGGKIRFFAKEAGWRYGSFRTQSCCDRPS